MALAEIELEIIIPQTPEARLHRQQTKIDWLNNDLQGNTQHFNAVALTTYIIPYTRHVWSFVNQ